MGNRFMVARGSGWGGHERTVSMAMKEQLMGFMRDGNSLSCLQCLSTARLLLYYNFARCCTWEKPGQEYTGLGWPSGSVC